MNRLTMIAFGMAAGFALSVYAGGSKQVRLPWATETIRVEAKGTYDGPRIQTGETDMETQVASLRIENLTEGPLDGTVTVQSGEKKLTFPFEALPPGQVTMVMAENAEHWSGSLQWVQAETEKSDLLPENAVDIQEIGDITLLLMNRTDRTFTGVTLLYKAYDTPSDTYIGGTCYTWDVGTLEPGAATEVTPYHYVSGYSRIVGLRAEE